MEDGPRRLASGAWAGKRLGPERETHAYAYEDLRKTMGLLALGTDFPVEGIDPLATFRAAVYRQNKEGEPADGYQSSNALSAENALRGMTIWNAISSFTEQDLGSLEPGKRADFVLLNVDPEAMGRSGTRVRVHSTFLGGERVH